MEERSTSCEQKEREESGKKESKVSADEKTHHRGPGVDPLGVVDETVLGSHQLGLHGGLGDVLSSGVEERREKERGEEKCVSECRSALTTREDRSRASCPGPLRHIFYPFLRMRP